MCGQTTAVKRIRGDVYECASLVLVEGAKVVVAKVMLVEAVVVKVLVEAVVVSVLVAVALKSVPE